MSVFPKPYADRVARLRVTLGFVMVIAFAWLSNPNELSLTLGLPISVLGLALRAWATGHLEKNQRLTESGPYAHVRNPLYLGTALVAAGLATASRSWPLAALFTAVFVLIYLPVIELEEQHLSTLFPEFRAYAQRVPQLIPTWGKARSTAQFRASLYIKNREYQALLGFAVGAAVLIAKLTIPGIHEFLNP
ncbi:MAG TPA: isoprenylcysteine carboxylmethyltransferase family protein [Bryobacteraceae bacterium]|nr:isoprenylcysteine carboxylmethyltransferase family protein [Bryobacteraceae bacterium]